MALSLAAEDLQSVSGRQAQVVERSRLIDNLNMNPDVIDVQPLEEYILRLRFQGGEVRDFDVKPYLDYGIFRELRDESYFSQAYLEFGSVEWPHGQGLSYDTLYLESMPVNTKTAVR